MPACCSHRVRCYKIIMIYPQPIRRALRRRRGGVGSVPAGGPIVDDVFLNCSWLEFRHVYDFHSN